MLLNTIIFEGETARDFILHVSERIRKKKNYNIIYVLFTLLTRYSF